MTESGTDPIREAKKRVAIAAAALVEDRSVVGLGTGSTSAFMIMELGRRVREEGISIVGIPTSFNSAMLARAHGIPVRTLEDVDAIDIAIDGADEIDPQRNLIKGGGGAHTREKVIASAAKSFVVISDDSKLVANLGERAPVPVEVIPMAVAPVLRRLRSMGGSPELRMAIRKDGPVITDEGNFIIDVRFDRIDEPATLERTIDLIPGVVENGLFIGIAGLALVSSPGSGTIRRI
jgi:ribose 5-phosphate isomerase A